MSLARDNPCSCSAVKEILDSGDSPMIMLRKIRDVVSSASGDAPQIVWDHWKAQPNLIRHLAASPPKKVRRAVRDRLAEGRSVETILRAISRLSQIKEQGNALGCAGYTLLEFLTREDNTGSRLDQFADPDFQGWRNDPPGWLCDRVREQAKKLRDQLAGGNGDRILESVAWWAKRKDYNLTEHQIREIIK